MTQEGCLCGHLYGQVSQAAMPAGAEESYRSAVRKLVRKAGNLDGAAVRDELVARAKHACFGHGSGNMEVLEVFWHEWSRVDRTIIFHTLVYALLLLAVASFALASLGYLAYHLTQHILPITALLAGLALLPPAFPSIFAYLMAVALTLHEISQITLNLLLFSGLQLAIALNRYVLPNVIVHWTMLVADRSVGETSRQKSPTTEEITHHWNLLSSLSSACTYTDWRHIAQELDHMSSDVGEGGSAWRDEPESTLYDSGLVENHLEQLRAARKDGDDHQVAGLLRAVLHRNFAGVDDLVAFGRSRCGTKHLVEEFRMEVAESFGWLLSRVPKKREGLKLSEMQQLVQETRRTQGRSALCLSGGGSLAMFHFGAVKELLRDGLLPDVVSGTSGGSIVAAFMSLYTDEELEHEIRRDISNRHGVRWFQPKLSMLLHFLKHGTLMDSDQFEHTTRVYYGDITFQEAYERSGRLVSIQVSVGKGHGLVLNSLTAPYVLLRSAVCASCALPGLMKPHALLAKNSNNEIVHYHPPGVASFDGTYTNDIPSARLTELFDCNHFIVSQVNPHVNLYLQLSEDRQRYLLSELRDPVRRSSIRKLQQVATFVKLNVKYSIQKLLEMNLFELKVTEVLNKLLMQTYSGNITLLPKLRPSDYLKILSHPTEEDMDHFIDGGARSLWPLLDQIRSTMSMELVLQAAGAELQALEKRFANGRR